MLKNYICLLIIFINSFISINCFGEIFEKPTTIYFTRHGETHWNVTKLSQGMTDVSLNLKGIQQAVKKAEFFLDRSIDVVYYSPLKRAQLTAQIIGDACKVEIIPSFSLIAPARSFDGWHQDDVERLIHPHLYAMSQEERRNSGSLEGLTSLAKTVEMVEKELEKIAHLHPGKTIVTVSHSAMIQSILAMHTDAIPESINIPNMAYLKYMYDGEKLTFVEKSPDISFEFY